MHISLCCCFIFALHHRHHHLESSEQGMNTVEIYSLLMNPQTLNQEHQNRHRCYCCCCRSDFNTIRTDSRAHSSHSSSPFNPIQMFISSPSVWVDGWLFAITIPLSRPRDYKLHPWLVVIAVVALHRCMCTPHSYRNLGLFWSQLMTKLR